MDYSEEYRELISVLEYIVARHCSTGGYNNDENYRYPVNFTSRGHHGKYDEKFLICDSSRCCDFIIL